jgi:MerR family transcriptional regulator, light-induced transcriptional regulator
MMSPWYERYLAMLIAGDRRRALAVVADARDAGVEMRTLYLEVFQPALREVGRLWQENEMSIAQEHLATAITEIAMAKLQGEATLATLRTDCTLVAACADSELHAVGLRMVCDLLEQQGWDVSYLGAAVPSADLGAMVRDRRPTVVALSASTTSYIPKLRLMIEAVHAADDVHAPYVLVGGRPFLADPSLAFSVGADSFARDAGEAVELLGERFG